MIGSLLKIGFRSFGHRYDYDTAYMAHVTDTSVWAGLRLFLLPYVTQFRGPKAARDVWSGAFLASILDGDCGPCAQLTIDMAVEAEVRADQLALCIEGHPEKAGDVGLGFRFARAAIAGTPELDELRDEIGQRFGEAAVTAASFAASSGRMYPVLKRGLGFASACSRLHVRGETIEVRRAA